MLHHFYVVTPVQRNQLNQSPANSRSSFVTATTQQNNTHFYDNSRNGINMHIPDHSSSICQAKLLYTSADYTTSSERKQYNASIVALGPTIKKVQEVLHNEITALYDRIDDHKKKDLVDRDKRKTIRKPDVESTDLSHDRWG